MDYEDEILIKVMSPIFRVPIELYCFSPVSKDSPLYHITIQKSFLLIEALSESQALISVKNFYGYWRNYNNHPKEIQKDISPFKIDKKRNIERTLDCELRCKIQEGEYICKIPISNESLPKDIDKPKSNEELFNLCCIEGNKVPDFIGCPYYSEISATKE